MIGFGNDNMKYFDYHLFSGLGWMASTVMALGRLIYQSLLTPESYRAVFCTRAILPFHVLFAIFLTWMLDQCIFRMRSRSSFFEVATVVLMAVVNCLAHISTVSTDFDSELATMAYTSDAFLRGVGCMGVISLLGPMYFCAGWVWAQIHDATSSLRTKICWRPTDNAWQPAQWYDWAKVEVRQSCARRSRQDGGIHRQKHQSACMRRVGRRMP
jgi:hypothetical protein